MDPYAFATSGGMGFMLTSVDSPQTLLSLLLEQYGTAHPEKRGNPDVAAFTAWAENYLQKHAPVSTFAAEDTVGVTLQGGMRVTVSKTAAPKDVRGTMQGAPLSPEQAQGVAANYISSGSIPMRPR